MDKIINAIVAIAAALTSIAESLKQIAAKSGTVSAAPASSVAPESAPAENAEEAEKKAKQAAQVKKMQEAKTAKAAAAAKAAEAETAPADEPAAGDDAAGLLGGDEPAEEEITQTTIRELGMKLLKADKEGSAKLQKILAKYKATNLTTLAKEHYKAVHDAVKALIKE